MVFGQKVEQKNPITTIVVIGFLVCPKRNKKVGLDFGGFNILERDMVRRTRRGERRSSFILKKARILVKLQLQLTSLHTRVVSLEVWILQMLAWSIIMSYIT